MKQITAITIRSLFLVLLVGLVAVIANLAIFPRAFAAEISVQTAQVLPPGGNSCAQLQASDFTAYIYDKALHSFEFSVPDSSYVAVAGSVGDTALPFVLMTRKTEGSTLRIHVDIDTTPIRASLPITVTLLSAKQGQPTCLSLVATVLMPADNVATPAPSIPTPSAPAPTTSKPNPGTETGGTPATTSSTSSSTAPASMQNFLKDICGNGRAPVMWFVLLVAYAAFVWAATSGKIQISFAERLEWTAAAIVVPLLLLLALWYFPENCRAQAWVPAVGIIIAIAALLATYGSNPAVAKVISLPPARK